MSNTLTSKQIEEEAAMHRSIFLSLLLTTLGLSTFTGAASASESGSGGLRYTIMVREFENRSGFVGRWNLGHSWATRLTSALHENGSFIVIGEADMRDETMEEQTFAMSGATTQGEITPERSQLSPAQLLVKGIITHYVADGSGDDGGIGFSGIRMNAGRSKTEIHATLQLVDSTTAQIVAAKNFVGTARKRGARLSVNRNGRNINLGSQEDANVVEAIQDAIDEAIPWLVEQLPSVVWRGSVVSVAGDQIYINRGAREGVAGGDQFIVGTAKLIRDPATGEVLDYLIEEIARIRADQVRERISICSVVSGDPTLVYERMGVQRARGL